MNAVLVCALIALMCGGTTRNSRVTDGRVTDGQVTDSQVTDSRATDDRATDDRATVEQRDLSRFFDGYEGTFVLIDVNRNTTVMYNEQQAHERYSPCSTFKIVNSLIGLETGVLTGADHPMTWDGTQRPIDAWNRDHTLRTAFANSVVWYYQELARAIGEQRMASSLHALHYGNEDMSGGLTMFWLESSMKISAVEQAELLRRLVNNDLPFSQRSMDIVKEIMIFSEKDGVVLRGKTGTSGDLRKNLAVLGWYVGYVTRPDGVYVFALNIRGEKDASGPTARRIAMDILTDMHLL